MILFFRFPDAVQREAVHRRSGIVPGLAFVTVPVLQRTTPLRSVLRRARETLHTSVAGLYPS